MSREPIGTRADIWRFIAKTFSIIHTWRTVTWIRCCYRNKTSQKRYWSDHFGLYGMKLIIVLTDNPWYYATFCTSRVPGKKYIHIRFLNWSAEINKFWCSNKVNHIQTLKAEKGGCTRFPLHLEKIMLNPSESFKIKVLNSIVVFPFKMGA